VSRILAGHERVVDCGAVLSDCPVRHGHARLFTVQRGTLLQLSWCLLLCIVSTGDILWFSRGLFMQCLLRWIVLHCRGLYMYSMSYRILFRLYRRFLLKRLRAMCCWLLLIIYRKLCLHLVHCWVLLQHHRSNWIEYMSLMSSRNVL
jgi:hypothetical protein